MTQEDIDNATSVLPVTEVETLPHDQISNFEERFQSALKVKLVPQLISRMRKLYGLSVDELSKWTGIPAPKLKRIEDSKEAPRQDERNRLGRAFGIPNALLNTRNPYRIQGPALYEKIKACAIALDLTQKELVNKARSSLVTIENLQNPFYAPPIAIVEKFASALKTSPSVLGDPAYSPQEVVSRLPKPRPSTIREATWESWSEPPYDLSSAPPIPEENEAAYEKKEQIEVPQNNEPITKKLMEARLITQAEDLFNLNNFDETDLEELITTFKLLYQIAKGN